jgi:hypothetical protein
MPTRAHTARRTGDRTLPSSRQAEPGMPNRSDISLLFTDVGLPGGKNGRQSVEEAVRRRPDLKILFISGYARNAIVLHGRLDAGVQLISKPFASLDLASKVR